jgi:hypothetical protein
MCKRSCRFVIEPWKIQYYTSVHGSCDMSISPEQILSQEAIPDPLRIYVTNKVLRIAAQLLEDEIYRNNLTDRKSFVVGKSKQMKVEDVDVIFME